MKCLKILNVFFGICIVKCYSMSKDELEEFSNFLKKTSSLDQTLKKAPGIGAFDEDEPISDVNAWEESGKFEGDLILNDRQRRLIVHDVAMGLSRNGLNDVTKRWPDNMVIFYIQREHFNGEQISAIMEGIEDLARASCVKFRPYKKGDRDAVVVQGSRRGCFSQVGYQGGYQVLNLSGRHPVGRGCFRHGTIVHEFLHTLGFYHMQSSPDRDDYIDVRWENILEPAKHNFRKYNSFSVSDFGVGYDYDSVLHYSKKAFSSNGQDTLVPKQSGADIGQRIGLSDKDTQKLNKMYCQADNNNNDDDGQKKQQITNKKRNRKNQPFDGHGIGYHQGKTVVIKVPTTTTIQVTGTPVYRPFDYSSELPTTPVIQRVGTGQEIKYWSYPYTLYTNRKTHAQPKQRTDPQKFTDENRLNEFLHTNGTHTPKITVNEIQLQHENNSNPIQKKKYHIEAFDAISNKEEPDNLNITKTDELISAIKRLEEIVRTRLVPIQYNTDYSKYQIPNFKLEPDPEIQKVDKLFKGSSFPHDKKDSPGLEKTRQFIKSLYHTDSNDMKIPKKEVEEVHLKTKKEKDFSEIDSSYRTAYPLRNLDYYKENHELAEIKYNPTNKLINKYNYIDLYNADNDTRKGSAIKAHLKIFGDDANPVGDPKWYRNEELNGTPLRHDQYRYTYNKPQNKHNRFEELQNKHSGESRDETTEATPAYFLFGKSVPTNEKWFKDHQVNEPPKIYAQNEKNYEENRSEKQTGIHFNSEEIYDKTNRSNPSYIIFDTPIATTEKWDKEHAPFDPVSPYSSLETDTYNKEHKISETPQKYQNYESEENSDETINSNPVDTSFREPNENTERKWSKDHTPYKSSDKNRIPHRKYGSHNQAESHDGSEDYKSNTSAESDEEHPTKFDEYTNYYEPPFNEKVANIKRIESEETSS